MVFGFCNLNLTVLVGKRPLYNSMKLLLNNEEADWEYSVYNTSDQFLSRKSHADMFAE